MSETNETLHGGVLAAEVLARHGVRFLFTLCGGHISPLLVGAQALGLRIVDVRHEATAVFAADAVSRLSGVPGVAAVTAGPGVTNTITAVKNAQLAQSPVVIIGGATATMLKGRGALQDIDQMALMAPHVKRAWAVKRVRDVVPALEAALATAQSSVPGPVFVELPVDLLYPESIVRQWHLEVAGRGRGPVAWLVRQYLGWHVRRLFDDAWLRRASAPAPVNAPQPDGDQLTRAANRLRTAERPLLIVGSQALLEPARVVELQAAVRRLGIPVYLSGMARGLLGPDDPRHMRHKRSAALKEADLVLMAGVPFDFRLQYGRSIPRRTPVISANRSADELRRNRKPDLAAQADPGRFLLALAELAPPPDRWSGWTASLRQRDEARDAGIAADAGQAAADAEADSSGAYVNPLALCQALDEIIDDDSILIGDGGDFVATASYIVRPRRPLSWLDPGPFGTLGVGAGFALGARLIRPTAEIWLLYGDGAAAFSLAEFDTFHRHDLPVIAVVGNDGRWAQIARDQVALLGSDVATVLGRADYHRAAEAYGAAGLLIRTPEALRPGLIEAQRLAASGRSVLVNVHIGESDFREGSLSV